MIKHLVLGTLLCCTAATIYADVVTIPVSQQGDEARRTELPSRGTHRDTLIERWGEPLSQSGPVGTPPIYRMDYADFFVVLEGKWVIRSVLKATPIEE
jgi:hypothetical protein